MDSPEYAIRTCSLTKRYGAKLANDSITLDVRTRCVFSLVGPNGAGKSTLVKSLVGLVKPTSGQAFLLGCPLGDMRARTKLGFLPECFKYQDWLTALEVLDFHARLHHMDGRDRSKRCAEVLEQVGLENSGRQRVRAFSKGMQQRLGIACALVARPSLVILDEPTSALDPIGRRHVRELLVSLREAGTTVFLNSHLLSEVESVSDEVAFIKSGRIVAAGNMKELLQRRTKATLIVDVDGWRDTGQTRLSRMTGVQMLSETLAGGADCAAVSLAITSDEMLPDVARAVIEAGCRLYELTARNLSLEELFVELVEGDKPHEHHIHHDVS